MLCGITLFLLLELDRLHAIDGIGRRLDELAAAGDHTHRGLEQVRILLVAPESPVVKLRDEALRARGSRAGRLRRARRGRPLRAGTQSHSRAAGDHAPQFDVNGGDSELG